MDLGLQAIHMLHLPTGKILYWAFGNGRTHNSRTRIYDPAMGDQRDIVAEHTALFCGGQTGLPDGRFLVAGGAHSQNETDGLTREAGVFDPWMEMWHRVADLNCVRWYPSVTTMADGRVIVFNGQRGTDRCADTPEIYDPAANTWTLLADAVKRYGNYPRVFVDPQGDLALLGRGTTPWIFDVEARRYRALPKTIAGGAAAMYLPGKVLKSGADNRALTSPSSQAAVIDLNAASPAFRLVAPMHFRRSRHTMKVLPNGEVLVVGGFDENNVPVLQPEIWNPETEQWRLVAPMALQRLYHSATLLWRDGRVLAAGGGSAGREQRTNETGEWYSPDYLFRGPRPTIGSAPAAANYGAAFDIETPDAGAVTKISLLRLDAPTHAFDGNQRFMWLGFTRASDTTLRVEAPANANIAPPGYYQLFLLSAEGVPSVSAYVRIGPGLAVTAADDHYHTDTGVTLSVPAPGVLANDGGAGLVASLDSGPANGTLTLHADGSFTYTPGTGFHGIDTFAYTVSDGMGDSARATVTIEVMHMPLAADRRSEGGAARVGTVR
jgi:hypothetical protein